MHPQPRLRDALVVEHERAGTFCEDVVDPTFARRLVADAEPPAAGEWGLLVFPYKRWGGGIGRALLDVGEWIGERGRGKAFWAGRGRAGCAAEADVVTKRVMAVVADDS